jgi:hypothetical protein
MFGNLKLGAQDWNRIPLCFAASLEWSTTGYLLDYDMEMLFLANESRGLDGLVTKHVSFANGLL